MNNSGSVRTYRPEDVKISVGGVELNPSSFAKADDLECNWESPKLEGLEMIEKSPEIKAHIERGVLIMGVNIKIGNRVRVVDDGQLYTSYEEMQQAMMLSNPSPEDVMPSYKNWLKNEIGTVVAIAIHPGRAYAGRAHTVDHKADPYTLRQLRHNILVAVEYKRPVGSKENQENKLPFQVIMGYPGLWVIR